ncbi:MAG: hypothetical protein JW940_09365 [Polyangiaceae bacterium]|nr:hypothetical protein [Polyangiaceae bacterium]
MTELAPDPVRPRFVVCEDGDEYIQRFVRFLASRFEFVATRSHHELSDRLGSSQPVAGILLDLDFRRTPLADLIDEKGQALACAASQVQHNLIAQQGICILAALRREGCPTPAILFADLESPAQNDYLTGRLGPLEVVPSSVGLGELSTKLAELAQRRASSPCRNGGI